MKPLTERFWSKVNKDGPTMPHMTTPCWVWVACRDCPGGYGKIWMDKRMSRAHRVAWRIANGPIPSGMDVLHKCDHRPCVNVEHLFLGTNADNVIDMDVKGRRARGERHGCAKLKESNIRDIFHLHGEGWTKTRLGEEFGVHRTVIADVLVRKKWAHVQLEEIAK